jgi:hypothetical protein
MANASDLIMVYSGGTTNTDPNQSLGGLPSSYPITGVLNNLFSNISESESSEGKIDYRCFYIFNNNSSSSLYNVRLYVSFQNSDGAFVEIGIKKNFEVQRITLSNGIVTGGRIAFTYNSETVYADWDSDMGQWAVNIQNALNNIFEDTEVTVGGIDGARTFDIKIMGTDNYRFHDFITINVEELLPSTITSIVSRVVAGAPINYVHDELDSELTVPNGVTFVTTDINNPLLIGTLNKEEGFPLWIKRTCPSNSEAVQSDGFKLKILSSPIFIS